MNFYDRTDDNWYHEKIKNNFLQISKVKYIKPMKFLESTDIIYYFENFYINTKNRKVLKISFLTKNKTPFSSMKISL